MSKLILALACLLVSQFAFADAWLNPGETRWIPSAQNVYCSPSQIAVQKVKVCDCKSSQFSSVVDGQAVGAAGTDLVAQCQALSWSSKPFDCSSVDVTNDSLTCDCKSSQYSGVLDGQAFGNDGTDLLNQCKALSWSSKPFNCRMN